MLVYLMACVGLKQGFFIVEDGDRYATYFPSKMWSYEIYRNGTETGVLVSFKV